jgi:hypothetical protein
VAFQLRIAHSDTKKEFSCLSQARAICATSVVRIGKLNRIIFPPAHFAQMESSGRFFCKGVVAATRAGESILAHSCAKYIGVPNYRGATRVGAGIATHAVPPAPCKPLQNQVFSKHKGKSLTGLAPLAAGVS